jgi:hypothetical protein
MTRWLLVALTLFPALGCISTSLERHTLRQSESLSDLRIQEVMNNLAMVANNAYALPSYSSIYAGTSDVTDLASATSQTVPAVRTLAGTVFGTQLLDLPYQRAVQQNWTLDPSIAPEKIRAMRCACRWVVYGPEGAESDFNVHLRAAPKSDAGLAVNTIPRLTAISTANVAESPVLRVETEFAPGTEAEFVPQMPSDCRTAPDPTGFYFAVADELQILPPNWLHLGKKCNVPHHAAYWARSGDTAVWVMPNNVDKLTKFTLVIQEIARVVITSAYYPQPMTRKLVVKDNDNRTITAFVDMNGFLTPAEKGTALPLRVRMDNLASEAALRSQIANSKSSP